MGDLSSYFSYNGINAILFHFQRFPFSSFPSSSFDLVIVAAAVEDFHLWKIERQKGVTGENFIECATNAV